MEKTIEEWLKPNLLSVQRSSELDLLQSWEGYLGTGDGPDAEENRRISTEMLRVLSVHFHMMHRGSGGAPC
jgi:hypothetical protein